MAACRFEHVSCSVPGSRFTAAHWATSSGLRGKAPGHGRPIANGHDKGNAVRPRPESLHRF